MEDRSDTSAIGVIQEQHDCDTSEKVLILITTRLKTYFHIPISTIWKVKHYKERNNFILSTTFANASFPCQNAFENCTTKTELRSGKSYIKKLYIANSLASSRIVTHSNAASFLMKPFYVKIPIFFLAITIES